jgi:hypothetical protein
MQIKLSSLGLANIRKDEYENDFTFYVGSKTYECPTFMAEFLSPRVSQHRYSDPTIRTFHVHINDPDSVFAAFLSLGDGSILNVNEGNREALEWLCCELGNVELLHSISDQFDGDLTIENVVERLRFLIACECESTREIEFAAQHFPEIQRSLLELVTSHSESSISILEQIICHDSLQLTSEDSLCDVVLACQNTAAFPALVECLKFEYLSVESMRAFHECIASEFDTLTPSIWAALGPRFLLDVGQWGHGPRYRGLHFAFHAQSPLSGIIAYMTRKHERNLHDCGVVRVTASSHGGGSREALLDLHMQNHFWTDNSPDQWICWDFKSARLFPTHYSLRAESGGESHPRHWVLEGSLDGSTWTELDRRADSQITRELMVVNFTVSTPAEVRMIQFRQTGVNGNNNHYLSLTAVEFFGNLREAPR